MAISWLVLCILWVARYGNLVYDRARYGNLVYDRARYGNLVYDRARYGNLVYDRAIRFVMGGSPGRKRPLWVPLSLVGGGLLLFLFAAGGIEDRIWQLALSGAGLALVAVGVLLLADEGNKEAAPRARKGGADTADYQIKILRPTRYHRQMQVEGGYLNQPPEGTLRLFTVVEDGRFRPQSIVTFDEGQRRWRGKVDLGAGPYYSVYVVAAFVDVSGKALWDYYFQVGRETNYWGFVPGRFGDYAVECGRFLVEGIINE